jgi:hypothetical protein
MALHVNFPRLAAVCSSLPDPVVILQLGLANMSRPSLASRPRRRAYIDKAEGFIGLHLMAEAPLETSVDLRHQY